MPVLEALRTARLAVAKVIIAENAGGPATDEIAYEARRRGVEVRYATTARIKLLAGNGRHDQGVVADVTAPRMARLDDFLGRRGAHPTTVLLLDGVTNPANVGMILHATTAREAAWLLREQGLTLYGLAAGAKHSIFGTQLSPRSALVLGGQIQGVTIPTDTQLRIPMRNQVESLNVAVTASIVAFEVARRSG